MSDMGVVDSAAGETVSEPTSDKNSRPSWRDHLKVHPAADLFPMMSESELRELGENIKDRDGIHFPLVRYGGRLLDGRNRLDALELLGITPNFAGGSYFVPFHDLDRSTDPYEFVLSANLHRRHLTPEQKRELIAKVLKAKPEASNATVAKQVRADDKTVAKVRRKLESTSEIPKLDKTVGADGKSKPKRKRSARSDSIVRGLADGTVGDACIVAAMEAKRATGSAEVSAEERRAQNAALDGVPSEQEAEESYQETLYEQAFLLLAEMSDVTRRLFHDEYMKLYGAANV